MESLRGIHPKKKPQHGKISLDDERNNKKISSDRILVENYFARQRNFCNILNKKFRWSEELYDDIFFICLVLKNWHIKSNPLRREDLEFFQQTNNRQYDIGDSILTNRNATQQRYRALRKIRMYVTLRGMYHYDDEEAQRLGFSETLDDGARRYLIFSTPRRVYR